MNSVSKLLASIAALIAALALLWAAKSAAAFTAQITGTNRFGGIFVNLNHDGTLSLDQSISNQ